MHKSNNSCKWQQWSEHEFEKKSIASYEPVHQRRDHNVAGSMTNDSCASLAPIATSNMETYVSSKCFFVSDSHPGTVLSIMLEKKDEKSLKWDKIECLDFSRWRDIWTRKKTLKSLIARAGRIYDFKYVNIMISSVEILCWSIPVCKTNFL